MLQLLNGERIMITGDGLQSRDFIFVEDTVRGILAAYGEPASRGRVVNLGSGREITILELVHTLVEIAGANRSCIDFGPERPGDVRRHLADISLARQLLGFSPTVGVKEGLRRTYEWYRGKVRAGRPGVNKTKERIR
jgi:dTDP-D-glucose 4,6-dehydratase